LSLTLVRLAKQADTEEVPAEMDIPAELCGRQERLQAIARAKAIIEQRASQRFALGQKENEEKIAQRQTKAKETGKKTSRSRPETADHGTRQKDQVNLTDEESRIMPSPDKGFVQAYNAQAAVDLKTMLVVESHIR
jgi:folylpolyglutamate synthase/dihydropteroate synthase